MLRHCPKGLQWLILLVFGLAAGIGLTQVHLPAAAMVGPMAVGAVMALQGSSIQVSTFGGRIGQGIAACLIAMNLEAETLRQTVEIWPVVLLFVALTFLAAFATGIVAAGWTRIDHETTIWGFLPGMMSTIIMVAHERGLDSRMVALIQILRLMVVIATMVVVAATISGPAVAPFAVMGAVTPNSVALVLALSLLGTVVAGYAPFIPAAASLIPLTLATILSLNGVNLAMPSWLIFLAFWAIGGQVGLRFTADLVRRGIRALPSLLAASLLLVLLCGISGVILSRIAHVDLMSGLLATVPGSIDSIAILALGAGADVSFVMTIQTVRLFAVAIGGPLFAGALARAVSRRIS